MEHPVPPELSEEESYHVFCSYSNTDQQWTHALIQQLEDRGLTVCYHERDFIPGCSILENMSESIHQSQKVLLVLSAEFLRSRWCLLEANMSLFRDCLQRKPIVPVLLQRDVSIPLHLSHLTYLDVQSPDFIQQLLRVLCTPNQELEASTVVQYQSPSLYDGKSFKPLSAVNYNGHALNKVNCGVWGDAVPDQLSLIIHQPARYREAIGIINTVSQTKVIFSSYWKLYLFAFGFAFVVLLLVGVVYLLTDIPYRDKVQHAFKIMGITIFIVLQIFVIFTVIVFIRNEKQRLLHELQKAVGQANSLLFEEKVLMGAETNFKLLLVYLCLDGCKQELSAQSQDHDLFHEAMLKYSSAYTCCLAKRYFTFQPVSNTNHLEGTMCFCQFVLHQRSVKETKWFCWWRKPNQSEVVE